MTDIYTNRLGYGEPIYDTSSDTVKALQTRLGITVTGRYDQQTDTAVRMWQASIGNTPDAAGRSYLGPAQVTRMFPTTDGYVVHSVGLPTIASAPDLLAPWAVWDPIAGSPGLRPFTGDARKITLHTTETSVKPNWAAQGTGLPHLTFDPTTNQTWQHLPFDIAAYTLIGGANSPNSAAGLNVQIEMIDYAENVPGWSGIEYENLQALLEWLTTALSIPRVFPFPFTGNDGIGLDGAVRQSWAVFSAASGIVGHSHAPYNAHWDPGDLDTERIFPAPTAPVYATQEDLVALRDALIEGHQNALDLLKALPWA